MHRNKVRRKDWWPKEEKGVTSEIYHEEERGLACSSGGCYGVKRRSWVEELNNEKGNRSSGMVRRLSQKGSVFAV